jgi:hypothetical protein
MECCLSKGELIRLDGGKGGLLLHCIAGTVWLTSGDGADYLIHAGKSFEIAPGRTAVVEALACADFRLGKTLTAYSMPHQPLTGFVAC